MLGGVHNTRPASASFPGNVLAYMPALCTRSSPGPCHRGAATGRGTGWGEVKRSLKEIRNAGIAVTVAVLAPGVTGVGASSFSCEGEIIGRLGIAITGVKPSGKVIEEIAS